MKYEQSKLYLGKFKEKNEYEPIRCFIDPRGTWFHAIGDDNDWEESCFSDIREYPEQWEYFENHTNYMMSLDELQTWGLNSWELCSTVYGDLVSESTGRKILYTFKRKIS